MSELFNQKSGFTLVEMMAVIVILSTLLAFSFQPVATLMKSVATVTHRETLQINALLTEKYITRKLRTAIYSTISVSNNKRCILFVSINDRFISNGYIGHSGKNDKNAFCFVDGEARFYSGVTPQEEKELIYSNDYGLLAHSIVTHESHFSLVKEGALIEFLLVFDQGNHQASLLGRVGVRNAY